MKRHRWWSDLGSGVDILSNCASRGSSSDIQKLGSHWKVEIDYYVMINVFNPSPSPSRWRGRLKGQHFGKGLRTSSSTRNTTKGLKAANRATPMISIMPAASPLITETWTLKIDQASCRQKIRGLDFFTSNFMNVDDNWELLTRCLEYEFKRTRLLFIKFQPRYLYCIR